MGVKFGMEEGTGMEEGIFGSLLHAKFHHHRCNVRGEKPQNRPLCKLNTGRFALRAMLPVNTKIAFFSQMLCICTLPKFNYRYLLLDFFSLFDSRVILTLLYDSLNLVINAFSSGLMGEHGSGERKSRAPQQLDSVARIMRVHQCHL